MFLSQHSWIIFCENRRDLNLTKTLYDSYYVRIWPKCDRMRQELSKGQRLGVGWNGTLLHKIQAVCLDNDLQVGHLLVYPSLQSSHSMMADPALAAPFDTRPCAKSMLRPCCCAVPHHCISYGGYAVLHTLEQSGGTKILQRSSTTTTRIIKVPSTTSSFLRH
jgi:hypothetical protein